MNSDKICSVEGCGKRRYCRGMCTTHYQRFMKKGSIEGPSRHGAICTIDGRGKPHKSNGLCAMHWWRLRHHGDPIKLPEKPEKPDRCCVDGCDNAPTGKRGMCNAHYLKWYKYGDPLFSIRETRAGEPSRWLRAMATFDGNECLDWPFAKGRDGRGRCSGGFSRQAPRAMCFIAHGEPPSGDTYEAAHSCGNGHLGCVNPRHLRWATPIENARDRDHHGTQARGALVGGSKLNENDVREIWGMRGGLSNSRIGGIFGVNAETIGDIFRGSSWGWLSRDLGYIPPD